MRIKIRPLIALAIAWPATLLLGRFMPATMSLPTVGVALLVSLLTGIISGFVPAWRAARMNPVASHLENERMQLEGGKPVGIFSERDFARKGIQPGMDAKATAVRKMMSDKLICVTLTETVEDCMAIMTDRHIRHLPVLAADGSVAGFLSIGDLVKETISEQTFIIGQLEHYITH